MIVKCIYNACLAATPPSTQGKKKKKEETALGCILTCQDVLTEYTPLEEVAKNSFQSPTPEIQYVWFSMSKADTRYLNF